MLEAKAIVLSSLNVYKNLAFEDILFNKAQANQIVLLIWRNLDSVVIGRNQNPWQETNLSDVSDTRLINLARRKSGGGTVFHDLGNTNWTFIMPKSMFSRSLASSIVSESLNNLNIKSEVNSRFDVCLNEYKISGSAFKISRDFAYHHGTMLLNSDLSLVSRICQQNPFIFNSKSVANVKAQVANVSIDHETFSSSLIETFFKHFQQKSDLEYIHADVDDCELKSDRWIYEETPDFEFKFKEFDFLVHRGVVSNNKSLLGVKFKDIYLTLQSLQNTTMHDPTRSEKCFY